MLGPQGRGARWTWGQGASGPGRPEREGPGAWSKSTPTRWPLSRDQEGQWSPESPGNPLGTVAPPTPGAPVHLWVGEPWGRGSSVASRPQQTSTLLALPFCPQHVQPPLLLCDTCWPHAPFSPPRVLPPATLQAHSPHGANTSFLACVPSSFLRMSLWPFRKLLLRFPLHVRHTQEVTESWPCRGNPEV